MRFQDIPDVMKKAVLAIEDYRFYEHGGVDFVGILRAGVADLMRGAARRRASTITMQVARNFFLSSEKTYTRKIYEMLLAYKIEKALTKDQILELYMNQIYLGQRSYGFAAAARVYFGKDLKDITLAEAAMLAGLPKAPSAYNPVVNPKRAKVRQEYILKRMLEVGYITQPQYDEAVKEEIHVRTPGNQYAVHGEYVAEMVRQMMYQQYKDETYTRGLTVTTTINSSDQEAAYQAVRRGILDYERRHGYRGPEASIKLPAAGDDRDEAIDDALADHPDNGDLQSAVVLSASPNAVEVQFVGGATTTIGPAGLRRGGRPQPRANDTLRIKPGPGRARAEGRQDGLAGRAAAAGRRRARRDRAAGWRDPLARRRLRLQQEQVQPRDALAAAGPVVRRSSTRRRSTRLRAGDDDQRRAAVLPAERAGRHRLGAEGRRPAGRPDDDAHRPAAFEEPRVDPILASIGTQYAQQYVTQRFGFDPAKTPPYLPMALGAGLVTPLQLATGYAVFANGGYKVDPYLIAEVDDARGQRCRSRSRCSRAARRRARSKAAMRT